MCSEGGDFQSIIVIAWTLDRFESRQISVNYLLISLIPSTLGLTQRLVSAVDCENYISGYLSRLGPCLTKELLNKQDIEHFHEILHEQNTILTCVLPQIIHLSGAFLSQDLPVYPGYITGKYSWILPYSSSGNPA